MSLLERPHPEWSIARANEVMFGKGRDPRAVEELLSLTELADAWKADLS